MLSNCGIKVLMMWDLFDIILLFIIFELFTKFIYKKNKIFKLNKVKFYNFTVLI